MSAVFGFFCRLWLSTTSIGSSSLLKCAGFVSTQEKRKISKVHHYFAVLATGAGLQHGLYLSRAITVN